MKSCEGENRHNYTRSWSGWWPHLLKDIQMECEVISMNRTKVVNWWGYGLEVYLALTEEDYRVVVCYERNLNAVIEG